MRNSRARPWSLAECSQSLPSKAVLLRHWAESPQPQPLQVLPKVARLRAAGRHSEVVHPRVQRLPKPFHDLPLVLLHALLRRILSRSQPASNPLCHRLASEPELSAPDTAAVVLNPEEVERLRLLLRVDTLDKAGGDVWLRGGRCRRRTIGASRLSPGARGTYVVRSERHGVLGGLSFAARGGPNSRLSRVLRAGRVASVLRHGPRISLDR